MTDAARDQDAEVIFEQAGARHNIEMVALAHTSIELGHLYAEDYRAGSDRLRDHFRTIAPWVKVAIETAGGAAIEVSPDHHRASTCFMVDDYSTALASPGEIIPILLAAADESHVTIDFLAREGGCAEWNGQSLAEILKDHLVAEPIPGTNGSRPPTRDIGWLSNGRRSPAVVPSQAMGIVEPWAPPQETGAARHSVFVDVELWDEHDGQRRWSCSFLASVWQMMRLGLLRNQGRGVAQPVPWEGPWPRSWSDLPPVIRLSERSVPFAAYSTFSILNRRFLATEIGVRTVLEQSSVDPEVAGQVRIRAENEQINIPLDHTDRIRYLFI